MSDSLWSNLQVKLRGVLPTHQFAALVESADGRRLQDGRFQVVLPDQFTLESFQEKCLEPLRAALADSGEVCEVELAVSAQNTASVQAMDIGNLYPGFIDPKYTFETFVVGSNNQFAHAACQAVAGSPGQSYNPLFIFGGAGLGKTHLLKAIGHALLSRTPQLRIRFLTSEAFTNELIQAIRTDRMRDFRDKYRTGCDVLLLDDVQFFAGKERSQEEFFYTFNTLHEARKQIVISSDRYPKDIQGLESRLQTRFEWGLVADVQPPEIETRIAILKNKADTEDIVLPDDVAQYIATHITSNIRELEGSLHRLQAYATLGGVPISMGLAQKTLKDISPKISHQTTKEGIASAVALHFAVRVQDLKSDKRVRKLVLPRQICMYLLRRQLLMSYPDIGKFLGKDHSTVMHGSDRIAERLKTDPEVINAVMAIESLIR